MADPLCRYCRPTSHPWLPNTPRCHVWHCYRPLDGRPVAHGHARYATENDAPNGKRIEAEYICVRSAYCNPSCTFWTPSDAKCPHFVGLSQINTEKT